MTIFVAVMLILRLNVDKQWHFLSVLGYLSENESGLHKSF